MFYSMKQDHSWIQNFLLIAKFNQFHVKSTPTAIKFDVNQGSSFFITLLTIKQTESKDHITSLVKMIISICSRL